MTKSGLQQPNYIGSLVRAGTVRLGTDSEGKDVHVPISDMLPMVHPDDFIIGGWDISGVLMDKAMERAKVLEYDLQRQLKPLMQGIKPMPSIYCTSGLLLLFTESADVTRRPRLYRCQPGGSCGQSDRR